MIKKLIISLIIILYSFLTTAQNPNWTAQLEAASNSKQNILLVFSGSDWCAPCERFDKEILDDSAFIHWASSGLIIHKADFPQRIRQDKSLIIQNEMLAEKYNPDGRFPSIILLNPDGNLLGTIEYHNQEIEEFTNEIKYIIKENSSTKLYKRTFPAMGSFFEVSIIEEKNNSAEVHKILDECVSEVYRIEHLISEWIDNSDISLINKNAGIQAVSVSLETFKFIENSIRISELTQGAFDLSYNTVGRLWDFKNENASPPDSATISNSLEKTGYKNILLLDENQVFLPEFGMMLGSGGIGQGYAVESLKMLLIRKGYENFVVNSSGDIYAHGKNQDGDSWKIGIANPLNKEEIIRWLTLENTSLVTSGNYENYFEYEGVKYSHIIDPKTGYPVQGVSSVSIISPNTILNDALSTGIFVMGIESGLYLINQLPEVECIIVDDKGKLYFSDGLNDKE